MIKHDFLTYIMISIFEWLFLYLNVIWHFLGIFWHFFGNESGLFYMAVSGNPVSFRPSRSAVNTQQLAPILFTRGLCDCV